MARKSSRRTRARKAGYRSGFEQEVADQAKRDGIKLEYETITLEYIPKPRRYKPDFKLANGIIVETKGRFTAFDRVKHLLVRQANAGLDIRFVFQADNKLYPGSDTRYSDWCEKHGFCYAIGRIPKEWSDE